MLILGDAQNSPFIKQGTDHRVGLLQRSIFFLVKCVLFLKFEDFAAGKNHPPMYIVHYTLFINKKRTLGLSPKGAGFIARCHLDFSL